MKLDDLMPDRLDDLELEMLRRVALAERFTSPTAPSTYSARRRIQTLDRLTTVGLVTFGPAPHRYRLTERGRAALLERLDDIPEAERRVIRGRS